MNNNNRPPQRPTPNNTVRVQTQQPIQSLPAKALSIYATDIDLAKEAHTVIKSLRFDNRGDKPKPSLTTTQMRKFLSAVNLLSNRVMVYRAQNPSKTDLSPELVAEVRYLKIKLAYQSGRESLVKELAEKANLEKTINDIGSSLDRYDKFAKYIEALVAYHKFEGGQ